jgi:predicted DNA-binding transcriptional regulator AlpA
MPAQPIRLDVMSADHFAADVTQPAPLNLDLLRITDIAKLLGVSRQRADQLASQDPAFPAAVALIGRRGQAYSRPAIEAYAAHRQPRPGRPVSPHAATSGDDMS